MTLAELEALVIEAQSKYGIDAEVELSIDSTGTRINPINNISLVKYSNGLETLALFPPEFMINNVVEIKEIK